ncbi:hypothetical protein M6B38_253550 [Iris pallida]|uniref:Uncharacterized protein n=1 Tax=Iris pallida TaxID=29817 RepID=A0AAX6II42_IRIPA|nr:hypothetical protein M6B38_253550 [Iris pallida]
MKKTPKFKSKPRLSRT